MHIRKFMLLVVIGMLFGAGAGSSTAQDPTPLVTGLINPRGMAFDSDGNLYVVEAGNGGDMLLEMPTGPLPSGATGQVTRIAPDGSNEVIIAGLPSAGVGNSRGAQAIHVTDDAIWLLLGETPLNFPFSMALVELDKTTYRVRRMIDLYEDVGSNPTDFAIAPDGTIYIANATCNCLQSYTDAEGVQVVTAWPPSDNPVPTSVAVASNGDVYVGFLTGFPFPPNGSRIERWSGGELAETITGLTAVVDLMILSDGSLYAVEYGVFENRNWSPGRVVKVSADGIEPVLENLTLPWGLAQNADGQLFLTINAAGGAGGAVIEVPIMQ